MAQPLKLLIFLLLVFANPAWTQESPAPADPHRAVARQLLEAMDLDSQLEAMAANVREMQSRQLQQLNVPAAAQPIIEKYLANNMQLMLSTFKGPEVTELYVDVYVGVFSQAELEQVLAFYQSETGSKFLQRFPEVMAGVSAVAERRLLTVQPQLLQMQNQLQRDLEQFDPGVN